MDNKCFICKKEFKKGDFFIVDTTKGVEISICVSGKHHGFKSSDFMSPEAFARNVQKWEGEK
jgi:hypothetical protein